MFYIDLKYQIEIKTKPQKRFYNKSQVSKCENNNNHLDFD